MAINDFKISYTFTVNPEEVSTPTQGYVGEISSLLFEIQDIDSVGEITVFAADIAALFKTGEISTILFETADRVKVGEITPFNVSKLVDVRINILNGQLLNRLRGLRLNKGFLDRG